MKIIVGAALSNPPYAPGKVWHRLHYLLGLQNLGHEVYFLEELHPDSCVDRQGQKADLDRSINQELFQTALGSFDLMGRASLIYNGGEATFGLSRHSLSALSRKADVLINWSGHITSDFILEQVKRRVFMDEDPVLIQVWQEEHGMDFNLKKHDVFVSTGLNIGTPYTPIPDLGVQWHHALPPVVMEHWPFRIDQSCQRFTTVATLSPFGDVYYRGGRYGTKLDELKRLADLPRRAEAEFEIAVKYYREEEPGLGFIKEHGWAVSDAGRIGNLADYQRYISRSRGEIGIVQSAQVTARSGMFSSRWAHYLASGKPVLAQSTGFERCLPTGRGLLSFTTMEEAAEGVRIINHDYTSHCRAARDFAEEYLDHRKVLPKLLQVCTGT